MLTKEWWSKNAGGLFLSSLVAMAVYAASAYITRRITDQMTNYVPMTVWTQWAQERGEWRGEVNQRLKSMESEVAKQREENLRAIKDLAKDMAVQTALLQQLTQKLDQHMEKQ